MSGKNDGICWSRSQQVKSESETCISTLLGYFSKPKCLISRARSRCSVAGAWTLKINDYIAIALKRLPCLVIYKRAAAWLNHLNKVLRRAKCTSSKLLSQQRLSISSLLNCIDAGSRLASHLPQNLGRGVPLSNQRCTTRSLYRLSLCSPRLSSLLLTSLV
jgi:hypothetical protein